MGALSLTSALAAAVGVLLASRGVAPLRRGLAFLIAVSFALSLGLDRQPPSPLSIASIIGVIGLSHALGSDLRARIVDLRVLLLALALVIGGSFVVADGARISLNGTVVGAALALAIASLLWLFGLVYARARGLGIDPMTGRRAEAFGSGDIPTWTLVGALVGSPAIVALALAAAMIVAALGALPTLLRRGPTATHDDDGLAPDDAFVPLLPSILVGTTIALMVSR
jgi:hypothetical protein